MTVITEKEVAISAWQENPNKNRDGLVPVRGKNGEPVELISQAARGSAAILIEDETIPAGHEKDIIPTLMQLERSGFTRLTADALAVTVIRYIDPVEGKERTVNVLFGRPRDQLSNQ